MLTPFQPILDYFNIQEVCFTDTNSYISRHAWRYYQNNTTGWYDLYANKFSVNPLSENLLYVYYHEFAHALDFNINAIKSTNHNYLLDELIADHIARYLLKITSKIDEQFMSCSKKYRDKLLIFKGLNISVSREYRKRIQNIKNFLYAKFAYLFSE